METKCIKCGGINTNLKTTCDKCLKIYEPNHYNYGKFECLDVIKDISTFEEFTGYLRSNVIKYLWRYKHKNGLEDLKKAQHYLNTLIIEVEKDENK